jgi:putative flavoprotein involved in K+ transport
MEAGIDRHEVVVIGGGQARLALGYQLTRQRRRFRIIDAGDSAPTAWRSRWDSLTLLTPGRRDDGPPRRFPGTPTTARPATA